MKLYSMIAAMFGAAYGPAETEQFLEGLFIGLVQHDDMDKIQTCIKDTTNMSANLSAGVVELEAELKNNLNTRGFIRGVKDIGKLITDAEGQLKSCEGIEDDMKRIEVWDRVFYNPETLAWTLMANSWGKHAALMENVK